MKIIANNYKEKDVMKILREWFGKKQPDFGESIGLSDMTIQGYERGIRRYTFETLMKVAKKIWLYNNYRKKEWKSTIMITILLLYIIFKYKKRIKTK